MNHDNTRLGSKGEAALGYAEQLGWHVFPCHSASLGRCSCGRADCEPVGKHPRTRNGFKDATVDPTTIKTWWRRWPTANIAVRTGPESNLLLIDLDGPDGLTSWAELEQAYAPAPATLTAETGRGVHLFFTWPTGASIRNDQGRRLGPGVDVRGRGGYAIVSPSRHANGTAYMWADHRPPEPPPDWLIGLLEQDQAPALHTRTQAAPARMVSRGYWQRALESEAARVADATVGTRNRQLNASAYQLGQLAHMMDDDEQATVLDTLLEAAAAAGLGERAARATIGSGWTAGQAKPRTPRGKAS